MESSFFDDFFHSISKVIIIIPIIILVLGIIIRINQKNTSKTFALLKSNTKPTLLPVMEQQKQEIQKSILKDISINGPLICNFSSNNATVSAYIKNKQMFGSIKEKTTTKFALLKDDCLYTWGFTIGIGEKMCGLKQYINMLENIPLSTIFGNDQLLSGLTNSGTNKNILPITLPDISGVVNSCKKEEIQNNSIFELPKNIIYKEKKKI